jgi:hypothetical protein
LETETSEAASREADQKLFPIGVRERAWQAAESGSFLKKRTKKLCEFGFGLSWKTEAE